MERAVIAFDGLVRYVFRVACFIVSRFVHCPELDQEFRVLSWNCRSLRNGTHSEEFELAASDGLAAGYAVLAVVALVG